MPSMGLMGALMIAATSYGIPAMVGEDMPGGRVRQPGSDQKRDPKQPHTHSREVERRRRQQARCGGRG